MRLMTWLNMLQEMSNVPTWLHLKIEFLLRKRYIIKTNCQYSNFLIWHIESHLMDISRAYASHSGAYHMLVWSRNIHSTLYNVSDQATVIMCIYTYVYRYTFRRNNSRFIFPSFLHGCQHLKTRICSQRNKFFPFRVDPFWKDYDVHESKQETHRICYPFEKKYQTKLMYLWHMSSL